MSTSDNNYSVEIEDFARRHYIKVFRKKHKKAWEVTERAILFELERIDNILGMSDDVEKISVADGCSLVKLNFKIAGTNTSAKSSGNRAIVLVDQTNFTCKILLVYSKNKICSPNETQQWMSVVRANYSDVWKKFYDR